jgi:hypothetical protein
MPEKEIIKQEVTKLSEGGILGRSRSYVRLLEYLALCSSENRVPKELEIASEVFGKGADFDPNQDSLVRVYVHNLRQKLDTYYSREENANSERIAIPKGEYRLTVVSGAETPTATSSGRSPPLWIAALIAALIVNLAVIVLVGGGGGDSDEYSDAASSSVWASVMDDDLPFLVVVGDYYIFAEIDRFGSVSRLVREFDVNSPGDLEARFMFEPELMETYVDLDLTYLPHSSATALSNVLRVVYQSDKPVRVTPMSDLNIADLRDGHVIYVGYISALDKLMDFVFTSSGLRPGDTYDELINVETGETYTSGAGMPRDGQRNYTDYGMLSTFPGPGGNQIMVIAGTRDEGLMHTAQAVADPEALSALQQRLPQSTSGENAIEALYEVTGVDRTNLDAVLVYTSTIDYEDIWAAVP